jgi:hypothetical protein
MFKSFVVTSAMQTDNKERRRYELKLSKAPNLRTAIVALVALLFVSIGVTALAVEIKVTDVPSLRDCVSGQALGTTAATSSPDTGRTAGPGDTCVVFDGVYNLATEPIGITVENLIVRSMNGATATIIQGNVDGALVNIFVRGVTFGGPAPDQGFTVTNLDDGLAPSGVEAGTAIGLCVTNDVDAVVGTVTPAAPCAEVADGAVDVLDPAGAPVGGAIAANPVSGVVPAGAGVAQENITIQNNRFLNNEEEGVVFVFGVVTAIDTIRILNNEFKQNGGSGLLFANTVGAIGRRGNDRNVVIEGNTFDRNVQLDTTGAGDAGNFVAACNAQPANIHFCNTGNVEQLGILNNTILRAGVVGNAAFQADGITFDAGIIEIRDLLVDRNIIHQNTQNGIQFDYAGRLGEDIVISNNASGTQGITQNGPSPALLPDEGNGVYITPLIIEVRGIQFLNNIINGNRGQLQALLGAPGAAGYKTCRDGNGISIEASGRVESAVFDGNDFRQNFNNGVCIANRGDFTRSQVLNNKFHNNGFGEPINGAVAAGQAPYGDGFGVYHDTTIVDPGVAAPAGSIDGFRVEGITFRGNDYRENGRHIAIIDNGVGGGQFFGFGFGVFIRNERQEISRITFENETAKRNRLGGFRLETDTDAAAVRSGDIREITFTNVQAIESGGDPLRGGVADTGVGVPEEVNDNGDGIALITDNGDISNFSINPSEASNNGGSGLRLESDATGKPAAAGNVGDNTALARAGDIDNVSVKDSVFNSNGDRAALGSGNGITIRTATDGSIRNVTIDPTEASNNNDHGALVSAARNTGNVLIENSTFNDNDRNRDTVGDGVQVTANEDLSEITVRGTTANSSYGGIRIGAAGRQIAQGITVENNTANDNVKEGVSLVAGRDLIRGTINNNKLSGNGIGVYMEAVVRGTNLSITDNKIVGANGTGVGIQLKATNVSITGNDVRNNATGLLVHKAAGSAANNNNIARNEAFGVDASALAPGEEFDATNNWWGEPSGPKAVDNPGGIGDRVTQKVSYKPFLGEPAVETETDFTVESLTASKTDATVGDTVTFEYVIRNNGAEEGTQEVTVVIKDGVGNVVNQSSRQITVNPQGSREENFSYMFLVAGSYTATVTASPAGSTKSVTVNVAGEGACLPFALDTNNNTKLDDGEIIVAIDIWVRNSDVLGCVPPQKIGDTQIIQLIDAWVRQTTLTALSGRLTPAAAGLTTASAANFATLATSVKTVRPGESFTVTVELDAPDGINGLLLSQAIPAGWTVKPIVTQGAYFKASENKWLWLKAQGTVALSYSVTVPANAAPGIYTIAGRAKAAVPSFEAELQPIVVEVLGAPVALAVKAITLSQTPVRNAGAYFMVEGVGIAQTTVHVFSMAGKLVYSSSSQGNRVEFSAANNLANGVYLYVVTVNGADGQRVAGKIQKLVVLR